MYKAKGRRGTWGQMVDSGRVGTWGKENKKGKILVLGGSLAGGKTSLILKMLQKKHL